VRQLIGTGQVTLLIGRTGPLADVPKAIPHFQAGHAWANRHHHLIRPAPGRAAYRLFGRAAGVLMAAEAVGQIW